MNSFKDLEEQESKRFRDVEDRVYKNMDSTKGMFHFIGDIIDLYIPQLIHFFVKLAGGSAPDSPANPEPSDPKPPRYPNTQ